MPVILGAWSIAPEPIEALVQSDIPGDLQPLADILARHLIPDSYAIHMGAPPERPQGTTGAVPLHAHGFDGAGTWQPRRRHGESPMWIA